MIITIIKKNIPEPITKKIGSIPKFSKNVPTICSFNRLLGSSNIVPSKILSFDSESNDSKLQNSDPKKGIDSAISQNFSLFILFIL